jgi:transposase
MHKCRLSQTKQQRLVELFISGETVRTAAGLVGVHRNTAAYYFHRQRELICHTVEEERPFLGEIEAGKSDFDGRHKGNRGRGAVGKILVFGILKGSKDVYTRVVPETRFTALVQIMKQRSFPGMHRLCGLST